MVSRMRLAKFIEFLVDDDREREQVLAFIENVKTETGLGYLMPDLLGSLAGRIQRNLLREKITARTGISLSPERGDHS